MIKSFVAAAALTIGLADYALAQETVTGAPAGTAPATAEAPAVPHHYHHHVHHYHHMREARVVHHHMHHEMAPAGGAPAGGAPDWRRSSGGSAGESAIEARFAERHSALRTLPVREGFF